jgi:hypothetical protein
MNIQKAWRGSTTAEGVIPLIPRDTPPHQLPSADRLEGGSASQGEQRVTPRPYVFVEDTVDKTVQVVHTGAGHTTLVEGNLGDPATAGEWFTLGTVTGAGAVVTSSAPCRWLRVRMSVLGIGGGTSAALVGTSN